MNPNTFPHPQAITTHEGSPSPAPRRLRDRWRLLRGSPTSAIVAALVLAAARALWAQDLPMEPGKTFERTLEAGQTEAFSASLTNGHLVTLRLQSKTEAFLSAIGPTGRVHRVYSSRVQEGNPFAFVVRETGPWRFVVRGRDPGERTSYELSGFSVENLELPPVQAERPSPRLQRIKNQDDADVLWKELEKSGAPLVEPVADDALSALVTFVWRGDGDTQGVLLEGLGGQHWRECFLRRLPNTDIWSKSLILDRRSRGLYRFIPNPPSLDGTDHAGMEVMIAYSRWLDVAGLGDPFNPKTFPARTPAAGVYRDRSLLELPGAPAQPWADRRDGVPAGTLERLEFTSEGLKNKRSLRVYLPPGYSREGPPCRLLLAFDGRTYVDTVPVPVTLDNLLAEKRIAPTVAVMVGNSNRDVELPWNAAFCTFLARELIPWLREKFNITKDPRHVTVAGSSYGGLAAASAAFHYPDVFGNVLSQSGSFWWIPPRNPANAHDFDLKAEPNHVAQQFLKSPKLPIRFYLDAGTLEIDTTGRGWSALLPNRHLRDVLKAKGYEVFYQEFHGGHDYVNWRGTIADGLIQLQ